MIDEENVVRTQWIIIGLIFVVLGINIVFILSYRTPPAGKFSGLTMNVTECYVEGLKVYGTGDTIEVAASNLLLRQENYAYIYCNGKLKDDPEDVAIPGIGCPACKPNCNPTIIELTNITFNETIYGMESFKRVLIKCA
jgi:hypothetical protein